MSTAPDPAAPASSALHHAIMRGFLDHGHAPAIADLAARFAVPPDAIADGLRQLARERGVVLHPDSAEVWVAHPFSSAPTGIVVKSGGQSWWGNCAWCAFGIAALLSGTVTISARLGGEGRLVELEIRDGTLRDTGFVVHFPVPLRKAWNNVIYTCAMMQFFESRPDVAAWCAAHGVAPGDIRDVDRVWPFARDWYGRHAAPDWHKWTPEEARAILARHGLDGPIWEL